VDDDAGVDGGSAARGAAVPPPVVAYAEAVERFAAHPTPRNLLALLTEMGLL
jgi:hypothetical protein